MVVLTVTDEKMAELLANGDRFEVRDSAGQSVMRARIVPTPDEPVVVEWPAEWTKEELDRRVREGNWRTTEQVMERLRGLTKCS